MTDWRKLIDWMHSDEVQATVAKYEPEEAEPPEAKAQGEPQQAAWEASG